MDFGLGLGIGLVNDVNIIVYRIKLFNFYSTVFCICDFILYLLGKGRFVLLLILLMPSNSSLIGSPAPVLAPDWLPYIAPALNCI